MQNRLRKSEMLMALVACLSFLWVAGKWAVISVPLTIAIVASWYIPQRYSTTPRRQRVLFSVIGLPFLALGIFNFTQGGVVGFQRIAVLGAVYVLMGSVLELYRRPEEARPAVFHAGVVTVMLVGGLTRANPYYLSSLGLYTIGLVGLLHRPVSGMIGGPKLRKSRAPLLVLVVGLVLALPLANYFLTLVPQVSRAIYNSYASTLTGKNKERILYGFSSDLSTVQELKGSDEVSLRVFGSPTFLRGQVFFNYSGGRWSGIRARELREAMTSETGRYQLAQNLDQPGLERWRIEPVKLLSGPMSVPPGAVQIIASVDELEVDPFDGLVADNVDPYQVLATGRLAAGVSPRRPEPGTSEWDEYYLQLPESLGEPLRQKTLRIVGEAGSSGDIAAGLQSYFSKNGRYDPGARHSRRNPVLHFLEEGELAGHCEYFATSMTLMLRSVGIPARYVVGYNAAERNPVGDYLIVRDRDAHAWVEAYVNDQWTIYDPTPSAERAESHPEGFQTARLEALWDYLKHLSSGLWRWVSDLEGRSLEERVLVVLGTLLFGAVLALLYRFRDSLSFWRQKETRGHPLQKFERSFAARLARLGLHREPTETLSEFAGRVRAECGDEPACWLEDYVVLRFRGWDESQREELAVRLEKLSLKGRNS